MEPTFSPTVSIRPEKIPEDAQHYQLVGSTLEAWGSVGDLDTVSESPVREVVRRANLWVNIEAILEIVEVVEDNGGLNADQTAVFSRQLWKTVRTMGVRGRLDP